MKFHNALLLCMLPILICADPYTVMKQNGNFTVESVTMTTPNGNHWAAGQIAQVTVKGICLKKILAGTVKYQIWESFVPQLVGQANFEYFKCTNKGCDPTQPVALNLVDPNVVPTDYTIHFQFQMMPVQKSGDFRIVFYGQDQDHFPYDFSATIEYNYTTTSAPAQALEAPATLPASDPYNVKSQSGNFTVQTVTLSTQDGKWKAGAIATVEVTGIAKKDILAGTVKYQVWESFMEQFVSEGNAEYFDCNNKGCNQAAPIALTLDTPGAVPTGYSLKFSFVMPAAQKSGDFRIVFYGQDQDHFPYDFSCTIGYNFSSPVALLEAGLPMPASNTTDPYTYTSTNGNFTVASVTMSSATGHWTANETVTIKVSGVSKKIILAGVVKFQVYESFVKSFVSSGYSNYFTCTNKGCDPMKPVALALQYPFEIDSRYDLTFNVKLPMATSSSKDFVIYFHGEDQDHQPYDFSASISYTLA
jgi:hypothetical protein